MRTLPIDKENCSGKRQKRSFEHGSCEGLGMSPKCKHLTVDRDHQSHIPQLKNMELGSERRVSALELPDTAALADATCKRGEQLVSCGEEVAHRRERITSRKTEMRRPQAIRDAVLGRLGPDDFPQEMHFNSQKRQVSSFNPWKDSRPSQTSVRLDCVSSSGCEASRNRKYNVELVPLVDTMLMNNEKMEMGYKVNEGELQLRKEIHYPKQTSGRLDRISSSGSEVRSGKYAAKHRSVVEMIQMNNDGKEVGLKVEVLNLNNIPDNHQADLCQDKVRKVLDLYKETLERLRQDDKMKQYGKGNIGMQIYVDAAMQLKHHKKWLNVDKCVGAVPGIEIGDQFQLRAELVIVGLHSKFMAGIDYKKNIDGSLCATSIITSGRYGDTDHSSNVLIYVGEGGKAKSNSEKPEDQKLVRGNLALKNNINVVTVRVIRRIQNMKAPKSMPADSVNKSNFFYDGLYFVRKCWPEHEQRGNLVYKFLLERIEGQQELTCRWNTQNTSRKSNEASHGPVVVHDISKGKENMPVCVVNAIDCERPPPFKYTTKMIYVSQQCVISKSSGCDCLNGCSEDIPCSCVIKNNCKVSVNNCISIAEKEPMVYECGPCCKCPPDCKNRMSQHGIKLQLEVFKTKPTGWGVRSRNFISKGRFICEYVGELLQYKQKEGRIDFDESAFDAGYSDGEENEKFGNVARFIRRSCSPNLYAKCVLFDHEDRRMPHVMLFAAKNIPPRKEFTFDYKLWGTCITKTPRDSHQMENDEDDQENMNGT